MTHLLVTSIMSSDANTYYGLTSTEQAFDPPHLSRPPLGSGPMEAFVPGPTGSQMARGCKGFLSQLLAPSGTNALLLVPIGATHRAK